MYSPNTASEEWNNLSFLDLKEAHEIRKKRLDILHIIHFMYLAQRAAEVWGLIHLSGHSFIQPAFTESCYKVTN